MKHYQLSFLSLHYSLISLSNFRFAWIPYSSEIYERISTSTRAKSIMQHRFKILWIKSLSLIIGNRHGLKLTLAKCVLQRAEKTQRSTSSLHLRILIYGLKLATQIISLLTKPSPLVTRWHPIKYLH